MLPVPGPRARHAAWRVDRGTAAGVFLSTLRNDCSQFGDLPVTSAARPSEKASRRLPDRPGPRRLRDRNKQEKLARIERAARQLFTQKGFEGTTTREIAQRARVGAGTLFLYAKDKRELLLRMFRADSQRAVAARYASIPRGTGLLLHVQHVFDRLLHHYAAAPDLARIFIRELLFAGGDDLGALVLGDLDRLATLVRHAQTRGEV